MNKQRDVVCGMEIDPSTTKFKSKYEDKIYYFCSENCKKQFDEDPEGYI